MMSDKLKIQVAITTIVVMAALIAHQNLNADKIKKNGK